MIHVKAYKLNALTSTRIEGGVTAASIPLLDVVGMSPIKKSLERDATQFEMSEVSLDIHGLPEDHFADHMKDGSGNKADRPYVFEIQYGSAWDAADSRVVFYGVLDAGSVQYDPKTEITSVSVLSWDKLLKDHPGLEARPTVLSPHAWG